LARFVHKEGSQPPPAYTFSIDAAELQIHHRYTRYNMRGNDSSSVLEALPNAPSDQRQQEAPSAPSIPSSISVSAPSVAAPAAKTLETSTPGGTVGTEDADPYPLWSRPNLPAVDKQPRTSSSSPSTSGGPTRVPPVKAPPASKTARCQYSGCLKAAKYGPRNAPPIACQSHKRVGQYTANRLGELLIATRDGNAFRTPVVPAAAA
ncbi:unnamed protein product, partial [Pylaiella littoralis]